MKSTLRFASIVTTLGIAACSGGSNGPLAPTSTSPAATAAGPTTATAQLRFVVPLAGRTTAASRKPNYVSPNTQSFVTTVLSNNGTAIPANQQQQQYVNVSSTSPNCTSSGSTLTCTGTIQAPVGNDIFGVAAYSGVNGSAALLSSNQNVPATIAPTAANLVAMTLDAIVAAVTVATSQTNGMLATQPVPGSAQTFPLTITAYDCTGAVIVGPGTYQNPISLALAEPTSAQPTTSLSQPTVASPSDAVTLTWTGSAATEYATIVPLVTNVPCGSPRNTQFASGYFLPRPQAPYLWTSQSSRNGSVGPYGWLVGYPLAWLHNPANTVAATRPGVTILMPGVGFDTVAVDHAGDVFTNIFTHDANNNSISNIYEYAPGATFAAMPSATVPSSELQPADGNPNYPATLRLITSDSVGTLYAYRGNYIAANGGGNRNGDLLRLAPPYTTAPTFYHDTGNNTIEAINSLRADDNANVFVSDGIKTNPLRQGFFELITSSGISGSIGSGQSANGNFNQPRGLDIDGSGNVFAELIDGNGNPSVSTYPYPSFTSGSGTATASFGFSSSYVANADRNSLARDAAGYIYVASSDNIAVFAPNASGTNVTAFGQFQNAYDPTTNDHFMIVPSGYVPPGRGGVNAMAAQR